MTKTVRLFFVMTVLIPSLVFCQRTSIIYTPSPRLLYSQLITPYFFQVEKQVLPVYRIEIIDNRYDTYKIGFHPEFKKAPREIRLWTPFPEIIKKIFSDEIQLDEHEDRKLIVVIQQCWISYYAENRFNILKKNMLAELQYKVECFTAMDTNYYPLKRMSGNIVMTYDEETSSQYLVDSMIHLIQLEIPKLKIGERETANSAISETRMNNYIVEKKSGIPNRYAYGVYPTFEDFLQQKPITDSIDIIPYKDYYERDIVAAYLSIIKNGYPAPCSKYWGFFDGRYLFYNTGNGYFVRMFPVDGQFVFADLQQVTLNTKKRSLANEAVIGKTTYDILKDYGKAYHLFFQLNYEDGKLY